MYRPHRFNFHREITDASFWLCEGKKRENRPQLVFKHVFGCLPNWMFKMPAGIRRLSEFEILICLFFSLSISEFPLFERLQVSRKFSFFCKCKRWNHHRRRVSFYPNSKSQTSRSKVGILWLDSCFNPWNKQLLLTKVFLPTIYFLQSWHPSFNCIMKRVEIITHQDAKIL